MRDGCKAREVLLTVWNSKLAKKLYDVQKHVAKILKPLPKYLSRLSSDIESGFQEFCHRLLDYARENV